MGIFMNTSGHPNLFKNNELIEEPNQSYFKSDFLKEWLQVQQEANDSFHKAFKDMRISLQKQKYMDDSRWREVADEIEGIKKTGDKHAEFEKQARDWLMMLEDNSKELHRVVEKNSMVNQDMLDEINRIHKSNEEIVSQLEKYEHANHHFTSKMDELVTLQQSMSAQIDVQNDKQDKVIHNIENQEALLEKSYRQLSNLRSILFERTSFVAEKIEESYKLTSTFLFKLISGNDKPLTLMMDQKKESKTKGE
ncbi:hypothetical protein [Ornithinibacillus xuwenensis]|uniref:t-SNARE coiled-coil homology domain-containing protein n=1 Tax=Ornithinibacillus xuwenensis TaxID=3144668 RepID=A0ABU9XH82_9BACI